MEKLQGPVPNLQELSDIELMSATSLYRTLVEKRVTGARACMRLHEDEMTRRFGGHTTLASALHERAAPPSHRWKFW